MPGIHQPVGSTVPKSGTLQYEAHRIQGIPLKIPAAAVVTEVPNTRIVSIQQDADNVMYAVISPVELASHKLIGWGVLEEASQSNQTGSISPTPNTYQDGSLVTVLRYPMEVYQIDYDPSNVPTQGIGAAYLDAQGRLSSSAAGSNLALKGSVFASVPGRQMANQLKSGAYYYQMESTLVP